jgi:hypothetical protein
MFVCDLMDRQCLQVFIWYSLVASSPSRSKLSGQPERKRGDFGDITARIFASRHVLYKPIRSPVGRVARSSVDVDAVGRRPLRMTSHGEGKGCQSCLYPYYAPMVNVPIDGVSMVHYRVTVSIIDEISIEST